MAELTIVGVKIHCSFGAGYLSYSDDQYRNILIHSSNTLTTGLSENAGSLLIHTYQLKMNRAMIKFLTYTACLVAKRDG